MTTNYKAPYKEIFKGDDHGFNFQIVDGNGDAYDLSSVTEIKFTVREGDTESASQVFQCTKTGGDITVTDATNGKIRVDVVPLDTSSATAGRKVYDIEIEDSSNKIHTAGKGILNIVQDITHS